jgi:hypothetical protein
MWLTWAIRSVQDGSARVTENAGADLSSVSLHRLKELGSRLDTNSDRSVTDVEVHQLVRFNLYNFGEQSATVSAIALRTLRGETLSCELVPAVVVAAGARYPMMVEAMGGPVAEGADIEVDVGRRRLWVSAQALPRP